jgi:recombinational DNA repair ATPase RecF
MLDRSSGAKTTCVGKNEAGKTAILQALYSAEHAASVARPSRSRFAP